MLKIPPIANTRHVSGTMTRPAPHIVNFCLKVWLTSIIGPTLFFQALGFLRQYDQKDIITCLPPELLIPYVIGIIFSFLYLLLFVILVMCTQKWTYRTPTRKFIIVVSNAVSITSIFLLLWGDSFIFDIELMGIYILISSASILIFKDVNNHRATNSA